ncbi:neurogenic protein mastermind isoform X4 [Rhynchophorus ferrugineus]|uniref:neurogenic protein mastermind isoform X4 n=1 Tax=Rhynchophorus ferrugineus TaxID=354439 RepID=UPI003FCEABCF
MPRFDQSFSGLCEQNLQDTLHLKQRFLDAKAKRVSKTKDKKQEAIQSSVHVQQKFLKRSADELEPGPLDNYEPPVKLQCTTQQHGSHQNEGLTKFSVEIVQQLEFTTSAANSQPQQISTNVTVKTHANASVKSDVSSPKAPTPGTPGHTQKTNIGLDVGTLVECVKQEPDSEFVDLDQCAAALEKDAVTHGTGFGGFADLMGDDTNDEIMSSAFKDLISDISNYPDYPDLMKAFDFGNKPADNSNALKAEELKEPVNTQPGNDMKHTQSPLLGNQSNFSPAVFEKNPTAAVNARLPYSNMDFTKTELSPAAQTLKQMAEQHQHKNQMGLNFNPASRAPNSRSPYSDFPFQGDYGSPNSSNATFHKNGAGFPQPDMIKQEMMFQNNDFNDMKRKGATSGGGMYTTKQQQYSPYGSPGQSGSPGFLNSGRGNGPNTGPYGGGTPPRPPSGSGGNTQGPGGTSVQINQAQQLNINQQNHGHIQVSAGQQMHLSGDIKGNVSIAAQQGIHFNQPHGTNASSSQNQQNGGGAQHSPMAGGLNTHQQQTPNQQIGGNINSLGPQMTGATMGAPQAMGGMQNPGGTMGGQGSMQGGMSGLMGGPNMSHGSVMGHGDSYAMSQSQTINFTQQSLRRATGPTGMSAQMGGPPTGPMGSATIGPRLIPAQSLEQQKLQQMMRAQQAMQNQQLRPPPPDYKTSAALGQGMQPRYGAPAPPPNMRRMPHQPIPPSGPMIRSNVYMLQQQQQQQQIAGRTIFNREPGPMGSMGSIQQNNTEWRHLLMTQQQSANFGSMRPTFQQGGFNINMGGGSIQQMSALQHQQQQQQLRAQQASMGPTQNQLGQIMGTQGSPMTQINSVLHMQQQQSLMHHHQQQQQQQQQQQTAQMAISNLHMQQSQSMVINNHALQQQAQQPTGANMIGTSNGGNTSANAANGNSNALAPFNPHTTDFNFEFLDNLPGTGDGGFTEQELLNSFGADGAFPLDF